jgi:hypothetical protein
MLVFPTWFSSSPLNGTVTTQPFGAVAFAGHTIIGGWCECGGEACSCDPGEHGNMSVAVTDETEQSAPAGTGDPGPALLMFALAFFLWIRLRA